MRLAQAWAQLRTPLLTWRLSAADVAGSILARADTLVLSGADLSAIGRRTFATSVWRSANDGLSWVDETADLVTVSPGPAVWYEDDLYLVTRGEGVAVKRGLDRRV